MRRFYLRTTYSLLICGSLTLIAAVWQGLAAPAAGSVVEADVPKPLATPPKDQKYLGAKQCSSCHFDQFLDWRSTKHAKGFDVLPAKYHGDASCLKCHTTGFGEEGGFKDMATTPHLAGASCESCHGPGSKHGEIAKSFGEKKLSKEESDYVRSTIYKMQPRNVCVDCHSTRSHKKHPKYDK